VFYRQEAEEKRLKSMEPRPAVYSEPGRVDTKPVYSEDDDDSREAPARPRTIREMVYADSDSTVDSARPGPSGELVPLHPKANFSSSGPASPPSPYVPRRKCCLASTTTAGLDSGEETVCLSSDSSDDSFDEYDVDRVEVVYRSSRKRKVVTWFRHVYTDFGSDTGGEDGKRYREARERRKKRTKRMKKNNRKFASRSGPRAAFPFASL